MPGTLPDNNQWLVQRVAELTQQVKALSAGRTQYAVDASGNCQAIYGALQYDHKGNATGLGAVYGIASFKTGAWVRL